MDNFASCFRRVYTRKELLDHLPQIMISWSEARSGCSAKAAGIPALKEWPVSWFAALPMCLTSSFLTVSVNFLGVSGSPFEKANTGSLFLTFSAWYDANFFRAVKGRKPQKWAQIAPIWLYGFCRARVRGLYRWCTRIFISPLRCYVCVFLTVK